MLYLDIVFGGAVKWVVVKEYDGRECDGFSFGGKPGVYAFCGPGLGFGTFLTLEESIPLS